MSRHVGRRVTRPGELAQNAAWFNTIMAIFSKLVPPLAASYAVQAGKLLLIRVYS